MTKQWGVFDVTGLPALNGDCVAMEMPDVYVDGVSTGRSIPNINNVPLVCQNGAKSGFKMCFSPSTLGAGAKTRLESRIKKFTPHCVYRPRRV